jgi:ubiquinone biosynthesis protein Coq4
LSITTNSFGQNKIGDIKIKEGERNITNLSGALNDSVSFHLIINKLNENKTFKTSVVFFVF